MNRYFWIILFLSGCSFVSNLQDRVRKQNSVERVALGLAKENRELRKRVFQLETELKEIKVGKKFVARTFSSEKFEKYQTIDETWNPEDILFIAEIEFEREDFEKSAYFFNGLLREFPEFKKIDDTLLYHAARANFEAGKKYSHTLGIFQRIVSEYPKSNYFLDSKLWISLIQFKMGDKKKSKEGLIEFKEKYQNTPEWKILEKNYEKIIKL